MVTKALHVAMIFAYAHDAIGVCTRYDHDDVGPCAPSQPLYLLFAGFSLPPTLT